MSVPATVTGAGGRAEASPGELVLRDLLDAAVGEDLWGLRTACLDGPPEGLPPGAPSPGTGWVTVTLGADAGRMAWPARDGAPLQPTRYAGGPVWHLPTDGDAPRPVTADRAVALLAGREPLPPPHLDEVCADLRTAVEHAHVTRVGRAHLTAAQATPRPGPEALLTGERLAATRNRPFHPTARAAAGWSSRDVDRWGPTGADPVSPAWVAVRRDHLRHGPGPDAERLHTLVLPATAHRHLEDAVAAAGLDAHAYQALPVHPSDRERILPAAFAEEIASGVVVPLDPPLGQLHPTASLRTLAVPATAGPPGERHVKLPLGVATLGAARLLPPRYLDNGDHAQRTMQAVLGADPALAGRVGVCDEGTWAGFAAPDGSDEFAARPGRLAAQIRRYPHLGPLPLPLAALAAHEWDVLGPALGVDGADDARRFFSDLSRTVLAAGVGFLGHGVLPEMHGQNVVCCLTPGDGAPARVERLVLRDHDTLRLHPGWARAAGTPDPGYRIAPGAAQSLLLERPEELVAYLQTLVVQVALYGVADALGRHLGVDEDRWWALLRDAVGQAVDAAANPVRATLVATLLDADTWPARAVLGPLLRAGPSGGVSMPAGTVRVPNPLSRPRPGSGTSRTGR